jgi:DNA-binding LytR/AlgR family response regulator
MKSIPVEEILFFYSLEKATFLCTSEFKSYLVDYSLDHISEIVDEHRFFRINRKYILSNSSISPMKVQQPTAPANSNLNRILRD